MSWIAQTSLKVLWSAASAIGLRRLRHMLPSHYRDTTFFWDSRTVHGYVALTIDDGLCRSGPEASLVNEIRAVLREHEAHATFFVCSNYLKGVESAAADLVADGHELGNHMAEDRNFHYSKLPEADFEEELVAVTAAIEAVPGAAVRWFRAPQGMLTKRMARVVQRRGLKHALGDAYCDDWAMAHNARFVTRTLLHQCAHGSIIILHQPERGFREHTLQVLRDLLHGLTARGLRCLTLSEMEAIAASSSTASAADAAAPRLEREEWEGVVLS